MPICKKVCLRIDQRVIDYFKSSYPQYQSEMNDLLLNFTLAQQERTRMKKCTPNGTVVKPLKKAVKGKAPAKPKPAIKRNKKG